MIYLIVGQRGTGKTHLARKFAPGPVIDLDESILSRTGRDAGDWISKDGEKRFREVEKETLRELMMAEYSTSPWIVLGAGFELDAFDWSGFEFEMIHWRRVTDAWGRIFTDRPRLNAAVDPLTEYLERYPAREERYRQFADWILEWPEGEHLNAVSCAGELLAGQVKPHSGIYTLRASDRERSEIILGRFVHFGFRAFELRTDLLSPADLSFWIQNLPADRILFAERGEKALLQGRKFFATDWALEWGAPPAGYSIWSNHGGNPEAFPKNDPTVHLKWSPLIESFAELEAGYLWQQQAPAKRSFLPRSTDGRWTWFRLWMKSRQLLNFVREAENAEAPDQPGFLEFINHGAGEKFAAVLGDPVTHSWTPGTQAEFFRKRQMPVFRIQVLEDEWENALPILQRMGLVAAAVTSPLKLKAFAICSELTDEAARLRSVNTLWLSAQGWVGHNTDEAGLRESLQTQKLMADGRPVRIYGGGGTLSMLQSLFPAAMQISLRTQAARPGSPVAEGGGLFIWAAGPRDESPSFAVQPEIVLDLNYRADSQARAFALAKGARFIDGSQMFLAQAEAQRQFWSLYDRK